MLLPSLGTSLVNIGANTAPAERAMSQLRDKLGRFVAQNKSISLGFRTHFGGGASGGGGGGGLFGVGHGLGGIAALGGMQAVVGGIQKAVSAASDLNEAANKSKSVFGTAYGTVSKFVDEMANKFGLVKSVTLDASANLGQFAQGLGFTEQASASFATRFTKLAADLSSFNNIGFDEALIKIQAALAGETEPLARLGVNVKEAAVAQYALAAGISKSTKGLTEQQKVAARAGLILRSLGVVDKDLDRTIQDYANSTRAAAGRSENLAATIGTSILPVFTEFKALINEILVDFSEAQDGMKSKLEGFADAFKSIISTLGTIYRNWSLIVQRTGIMVGGYILNVVETFQWLGKSIGAFLDWFGTNWKSIFKDAFEVVTTALINLGQNFRDFGKAAFDWITSGFQKPFEFKMTPIMEGVGRMQTPELKMPKLQLSDVDDQLKEVDEKMVKVEQKAADKRNAAKADAAKKEPPLPTKAEDKKKPEFIKLDEFAKKIQLGALGKDDLSKKTADNTGRAAAALERMEKVKNKPPAARAVGPE